MQAKAYAAQNAKSALAPWSFERRDVGPRDVLVEIDYCGVCHSDIHQARDEWGGSIYPMVPGHEIVGRVTKVGREVTRFKVGDRAGVGCLVDSCRECSSCRSHEEQYCLKGFSGTYNSREQDGKTPTYGGYSSHIVVTEDFTLKMPTNLDAAASAPLLCAGITTYSPLRHWKVSRGQKVGIVGLGGLGHMGVKFAAAFGAEVTVFSTTRAKEADAKRLGAHHFVATKEAGAFEKHAGQFDFLLDTVSAPHDLNQYLGLLRLNGTLVCVGVPPDATPVHAFSLILARRQLGGSLIGGIRETQEMLDFCGQHGIVCDVEVIPVGEVNGAYDRMLRNDVRYRFVLDMKTL
jgi:uncharacterized zinc-type alcohol dehydrogenase-like protein